MLRDKSVSLPGIRCAYYGTSIGGRLSTNDHVVARRFVPEGTLGTGFHLQVKSCRPCNDRKARLEDDISIITMLPDTAGRYVREDERLTRTVVRKARGAISPATRRLVSESYNELRANIPLGGGVSLTYSGLAMPTLEDLLVNMQLFSERASVYRAPSAAATRPISGDHRSESEHVRHRSSRF